MRRRLSPLLLAAVAAAWGGLESAPASAQALLELTDAPRPGFPTTWEVTNLTANADVIDQAASVRLSQTFKNVGSRPLEARILFPLPPGAAVRELTLLVDGKELTGTLQPVDEARDTYEAIVRRDRDPALLEYAGRGLYRTSVFPIPAGAERTVQLRYTQLLGTREGLIDLTIPVGSAGSNGKPIGRVEVTANVKTSTPLKVVYSPTHPVEIDRPTDATATAKLELENVSGRQDVRLLFGTSDGLVGLNALAFRDPTGEPADGDGFFLLLAAPDVPAPDDAPPPRTLAVVIDTSGSMQGEKMEQARAAAAFVVRPAAAGGHLQRRRLQQHGAAVRPRNCKPARPNLAKPRRRSSRGCGPAGGRTSTPPSRPSSTCCPPAGTDPPTSCSSPTASRPWG